MAGYSGTYTVKIENLSKVTSETDLKGRLGQIVNPCLIKSTHVRECPNSPANYAYVNCASDSAASAIVLNVNKAMVLHSNLLSAKMKSQSGGMLPQGWPGASVSRGGIRGGGWRGGGLPKGFSKPVYLSQRGNMFDKTVSHVEPRGVFSPKSPDAGHSASVQAVKVLIHEGDNLTGSNLDSYFGVYGEMSANCIIRKGTPDYSYLNFRDPLPCQTVRSQSPYLLNGATIIALPNKPQRNLQPGRHFAGSAPKVELVNETFSCDPLAIKAVEESTATYLKESGESGVRLIAERGAIRVCAEKEVARRIGCLINSSINDHEAKISCLEHILDCYYLPALADRSVQDELGGIKQQFEVKILQEKVYVPLRELSQVYSKCDVKSVEDSQLSQYLLPGKSSTRYVWFWEESTGFQEYDTSLSEKLELAYGSKLTILESIGRYKYEIDTLHLQQLNTTSNKVRRVERRPVHETEQCHLRLQIRAHSDSLQVTKDEITSVIQRKIECKEITIPFRVAESADHLLRVARRGFISAENDCGETIVLRGVHDAVIATELQLTKTILDLQQKLPPEDVSYLREGGSGVGVTTPDNWEPQTSKCELKDVREGTEEWASIHKRVTDTDFNVRLVQVQRIQNIWLWEIFERSRCRMSEKNQGQVNEKLLFHGTKTTPPIKIYNSEQGFDNRLASQGLWGEGTYYAVKARYSDRYAHITRKDQKQMFLVQVITGITCRCRQNHSLKAPPKKVEHDFGSIIGSRDSMFEDERYDSVSGNTNGSDVFVIYEHGKVYPAYLITYDSR